MNILIQFLDSFGVHYSKDYTETDFHFGMRVFIMIRNKCIEARVQTLIGPY